MKVTGVEREDYTKITVVVKAVTEKAVRVAYEDEETWIPRSMLGLRTDRQLDACSPNDEVILAIPRWKLKKLGWV